MKVVIRRLGRQDYQKTWRAMQRFTTERGPQTPDEIWLLEHEPVYTLGLNGLREHILATNGIPVIHCDRGGQVTYHGPGQLIVYTLIDLQRRGLGIRTLIDALQDAVIGVLAQYGIHGSTDPAAPGVYVAGRKIASLGLRVRRGCSYHGLSFNVAMDLTPFQGIHPCGYPDLEVTQLCQLEGPARTLEVAIPLVHRLTETLGYREVAAEADASVGVSVKQSAESFAYRESTRRALSLSPSPIGRGMG